VPLIWKADFFPIVCISVYHAATIRITARVFYVLELGYFEPQKEMTNHLVVCMLTLAGSDR
jgi:hypothetical protein